MYKLINKKEGFAIMNGINDKSIFWLPNGIDGEIRPYHIIDAVTIGDSKANVQTFALLEHETLGEDDCVVVMLPKNNHLIMMIREDHIEWRDSQNMISYFIPTSRIIVGSSYNGLDDLKDEGWDLTKGQYWTDDEINDR